MKSKTIYFLDKFRKLSMHCHEIFLSDSSPVQRCNRFSVQYFVSVYLNLVQYLSFIFFLIPSFVQYLRAIFCKSFLSSFMSFLWNFISKFSSAI